jgi:putative ATP-binding cassette transporter
MPEPMTEGSRAQSTVTAPRAGRPGFARELLQLAAPYWNGPRRWRVRGVVALLLALTLAQVGLTVWGNWWNRALFDALESRSVPELLRQSGIFALILAISIAVTAAHLLTKRRLQLDWREWLTERFVGRWLDDARHYRLQFGPDSHDNPDQRIAEDIRIATESAVALAHTLVFSLLILVTFIDILWSVSGTLNVPGTALQVPGYMVPLAFAYAGAGALLGWRVGRPLIRTTNALQSAEASFRYGLARVREHAEAIALMHGEPGERALAAGRFRRIVEDWDRQSLAYLGLVSFSTAYGALLPVFPILVAAPQYVAGGMTLGVLMQAAQAFQRLTGALSWPVDNVGEIARCRTSVQRVLALDEDVGRLDALATGKPAITLATCTEPWIAIRALRLAEQSGLVLIDGLDAEIHAGERVLVTGDPAVTTRLFKALAGLWPWGTGRIELPPHETVAFMPQRPFLPEGTLRDALTYPRTGDGASDELIVQALVSRPVDNFT